MLTGNAQFQEFTELLLHSPVGQLPLLELGTNTKISHVISLLHANTHMQNDSRVLVGLGDRKYYSGRAIRNIKDLIVTEDILFIYLKLYLNVAKIQEAQQVHSH